MQRVVDLFVAHVPDLVDHWVDAMYAAQLPSYKDLPREQTRQMMASIFQPLTADLSQDSNTAMLEFGRQSTTRIRSGIGIGDLFDVLTVGRDALTTRMGELLGEDYAGRAWFSEHLNPLFTDAMKLITMSYVQATDQRAREQSALLHAISTPIVPIYTGVVVVPLIGAIDSARAMQIMEALLESIAAQQSEVVIIDITGVPMVDTAVANYLLQMTRAANLLGSQVVLVGIGAAVAQTIVQLGVDLSLIATRANLQSGIEYALSLQDLAISSRPALVRGEG